MKKQLYSFICILLGLMCLVSCETGTDEPLSVQISGAHFDGLSLSFMLDVSGAERLSYTVFPVSAGDGAEVFADSAVSQSVSVPDIAADQKYVIRARAYSSGGDVAEDMLVYETLFSSVPYRKTVLVTKFTGTWCGYCPQMTAALEDLETFYPGGFTILAVHGGDDLENSDVTVPLEDKFGITGYPTAIIDYTYSSTQQLIMLRDRMEKTLAENPAFAGVAIETAVQGDEILVDAEVEFGVSGNWRICCVLTEDRIYREGTGGSVDGWYDHVVRVFATDPEGDDVGNMKEGSLGTFSWAIPLDAGWNVDNCSITVFILRESQDGVFFISNANFCRAGSSADIMLEE